MKFLDENGNDITPLVLSGGFIIIGFIGFIVFEYYHNKNAQSVDQTGAIQSYIETLDAEVQDLINQWENQTSGNPPVVNPVQPIQPIQVNQPPIIINYPTQQPVGTIYNSNTQSNPSNQGIPNSWQPPTESVASQLNAIQMQQIFSQLGYNEGYANNLPQPNNGGLSMSQILNQSYNAQPNFPVGSSTSSNDASLGLGTNEQWSGL